MRAAREVAEGGADAMVSCGSTGATMAAATFGLRRLKGVQRPALAVQLPVPGKPVALPRRRRQRRGPRPAPGPVRLPRRRLQRRGARGRATRRVGLLTVGEESGKGREEVVEAHRLLARRRGIDFAGNVEGARPAGRGRRRRRHRRLHRQRRPEADGGHREDRRRARSATPPAPTRSPRSAACC